MALDFEEIIKKLQKAGIESPRLEARLMVAAAKGIDSDEITSFGKFSVAEEEKIIAMLNQRLNHRPLDKILGHRGFYKYDFICNDDVLSPRPDTEILVEEAAKLIFKHNFQNILELGVGSGCILLSLLADFPHIFGTGIDISKKALKTAEQNAERLTVQDRVKLLNGDWNAVDFVDKIGQNFDIIISNPPYIPSSEIATLAPEVRKFDPIIALDGGKSGFDAYRRIAQISPCLLKDGGYLLLEAGYNQAETIKQIFAENQFILHNVVKDLNGINRCIILQKVLAK